MSDFDWQGLLEKVVITAVILIVTFIIAKLVKWGVSKLAGKVAFLQRAQSGGGTVGESIGSIGSLVVWLFGLVAILQVFKLEQVVQPINGLLGSVMGFIPRLIGAGIVFVIGFMLAKVVRQLVEAALQAARVDRFLDKVKSGDAVPNIDFANEGVRPAQGVPVQGAPVQQAGAPGGPQQTQQLPQQPGPGQPMPPQPGPGQPMPPQARPVAAPGQPLRISSVVANLLFGIIMIVISISALQILGITAISAPAEQMLTVILNAIPAIIAAGVILGLGIVIAKFVGNLLGQLLEGVGTDAAVAKLGVLPADTKASGLITKIVQVAIVFFFAIGATRMLGFPEITAIIDEVLRIGGRVLFGGAIIGAGYLLARTLSKLVSGTATNLVFYGVLILFSAIGLRYMGLADSIINLAFGALVVGGALAAALAFGIGGRDAAARKLEQMEKKGS